MPWIAAQAWRAAIRRGQRRIAGTARDCHALSKIAVYAGKRGVFALQHAASIARTRITLHTIRDYNLRNFATRGGSLLRSPLQLHVHGRVHGSFFALDKHSALAARTPSR